MTKIQEIRTISNLATAGSKAPSFGSAASEIEDITKVVARQLEEETKKDYFSSSEKKGIEKVKGYLNSKINGASHFLNENSGEIQNQILNGAFTATLAPLVILKNPLLQKNEDDKKYAALRQPVSAALAMSTGLGMTIGINKGMNKLFDSGLLAANDGSLPISLDGRMQPSDDFAKRQFNAELAKVTKGKSGKEAKEAAKAYLEKNYKLERAAKPNILDKILRFFITEKATQRATDRAYLKVYTKVQHAKREDLFTRLHGDTPGTKDTQTTRGTLGTIQFDKTTNGLFRIDEKGNRVDYGKVAGFNSNDDIIDYTDKHNLNNKKLSDVMLDKYGFETYEDGPYKGQIKPSSTNKLSKIKAADFLRDIGLVGDDMIFHYTDAKGRAKSCPLNDKNLNLILNILSDEKSAKRLEEILKDPEKAKKLAQAEGKSNSRTVRMAIGTDKLDAMSAEDIFRRIGYLSEDQNTQAMTLLEKLKQPMNKISAEVAKKMKIYVSKNEGEKIEVEVLHAAKNMTKNAISKLKAFKTYSNYAGIFFNLGTTAIGCTLLNALYPPFVALVAPDLAKDKTETPKNGGSK